MHFVEKLQIHRLSGIRLSVKLVLGLSLILLVVMGLFTYYDMVTRTKFHFDMQKERAYEISDTVMRSIEYPMLDGKMEDVQAVLERLNTLKDVKVVNLCDDNGTIKYSGVPANRGTACSLALTKEALLTCSVVKGLEIFKGEKVLYHAMPISNEKTCYRCHGSKKRVLGVLTVGISWAPIEKRIASLINKVILFSIISLLVVGFFLALFLSKYITKPLSLLTRLADEISRGKDGFEFGRTVKCWEVVEKCDRTDCPAYGNPEIMCWYLEGTLCKAGPSGSFPTKLDICRKCIVYRSHVGDEMVQLADSFKHMLYRLRASEKELMQSEEKYRSMFDTDPNPIFILDRETLKILDANARAESQYGYSREGLLKMSFVDLGYEEDAREFVSGFENLLDSSCILFTKKQHRRKDGSVFYANIHVCGARYMGKDALIATTADITESIEKDAQLIQASKLSTLGEMAAGIAHELNQPLNVIKIGSAFFRDAVKEGKSVCSEEFETVCDEISDQVDRASGIINHMREFARSTDITTQKVDVNKPIRDVFKVLSEQLRLRQIELELDLEENLPMIMGDTNRLEQVFINLVTNARDALEEKDGATKLLKIRSFLDQDSVVITISDTGKGIPKSIVDRIFEPFFTTKEVGEGTGLGLSISYGIIRDYAGSITVESDPEKGTTFEVRFPSASDDVGD